MKSQDRNSLLILGAAGVGVFVVFKLLDKALNFNKGTPYEGAGAVGTAANIANQVSGGVLAKAGAAFGRALYDWTHPGSAGEALYYSVTFPDGQKHAIASGDVAKNGTFTYKTGARFRIVVDSLGFKFAAPL